MDKKFTNYFRINFKKSLFPLFGLAGIMAVFAYFNYISCLYAACTGMSVSSITLSDTCGAQNDTVDVSAYLTNIGTSCTSVYYAIGFKDSGGNIIWYGNSGTTTTTCNASNQLQAYFSQTNNNNNNMTTTTQTLTIPNAAVSIIFLARTRCDTTTGNREPYCDDSNCTVSSSIAFKVPCTPTFTPSCTPTRTNTPVPCKDSNGHTCTPTKTETPTITFTPTKTNTPNMTQTVGGMPTNTFTFTFTYTRTNTYTPTISYTPTITSTPTITNTPLPNSCNLPNGATPGVNLQGGVTCWGTTDYTCLDASSVFGMSLGDLKNISDYQGNASTTMYITSEWKLCFFDGSVTYGPANPSPYDELGRNDQSVTTGAYGVLIVNGDLVLNQSTGSLQPSHWGGILFVTGNLTVGAGCDIEGSVIMGSPYYHGTTPGTITINGSAGNYGQIFYNPDLVVKAQKLVGNYREDISQRKMLLAIPNL